MTSRRNITGQEGLREWISRRICGRLGTIEVSGTTALSTGCPQAGLTLRQAAANCCRSLSRFLTNTEGSRRSNGARTTEQNDVIGFRVSEQELAALDKASALP